MGDKVVVTDMVDMVVAADMEDTVDMVMVVDMEDMVDTVVVANVVQGMVEVPW